MYVYVEISGVPSGGPVARAPPSFQVRRYIRVNRRYIIGEIAKGDISFIVQYQTFLNEIPSNYLKRFRRFLLEFFELLADLL